MTRPDTTRDTRTANATSPNALTREEQMEAPVVPYVGTPETADDDLRSRLDALQTQLDRIERRIDDRR
jgi:hypothetical protein